MRGLTADEADELDANNEMSMCNCGPNGEPGAFVRRPIVTERLVRQGRAEWVSCPLRRRALLPDRQRSRGAPNPSIHSGFTLPIMRAAPERRST